MDKRLTEADLQKLRDLPYKTPFLERLLAERCSLDDDFHQHLLQITAPKAMAYNAIMVRFNGDPSGIEFSTKDRQKWAFVLPDASEPGRHRIQYFDERSFFSHHPYDTVTEAVLAMVTEGYEIEDAGALDRVSATETWRKGTAVAAIKMKLDRGLISWKEFTELAESA